VLSSKLVLYCLYANTGKEAWKRDLIAENAGRNITWQSAASPLIDEDLISSLCGGPGQRFSPSTKAMGRSSGKARDDTMTHSTPTVATILGTPGHLLYATRFGLSRRSDRRSPMATAFSV
jgi:hypothetical protein